MLDCVLTTLKSSVEMKALRSESSVAVQGLAGTGAEAGSIALAELEEPVSATGLTTLFGSDVFMTVFLVFVRLELFNFRSTTSLKIVLHPKTMLPEDLLTLRYGAVRFTHVGDLKITGTDVSTKEMAFYGARIKTRNMIPYNLLIVAVPLQYDVTERTTALLSELKWITIYQRSYFDLKHLQASIKLDWSKISESPEYSATTDELPGGMWINEVKEKTVRGQKNKYYSFSDPSIGGNYIVSVESRIKDATYGSGLKTEYEFDLLLNFDNYNLAIERFTIL